MADDTLTKSAIRAIASTYKAVGAIIAPANSARMDSWYNSVTGLGTSRDKSQGVQFGFRGFLDPLAIEYMCTEVLFQIIADSLPNDACQEGFDLTIEEDDDKDIQS